MHRSMSMQIGTLYDGLQPEAKHEPALALQADLNCWRRLGLQRLPLQMGLHRLQCLPGMLTRIGESMLTG